MQKGNYNFPEFYVRRCSMILNLLYMHRSIYFCLIRRALLYAYTLPQ